jgi:hypothetical protein
MTLHQAAVGNNSPDQKKSRHLNKMNLVNNFNNLSLTIFMESLLPFSE